MIVAVVVGGGVVGHRDHGQVLTGGPLPRRGPRKFGIGVAAAAVTCGPGRVFGTVLG